jgi:hypothetical protein
MAKCHFEIAFPESAKDLLAIAKASITRAKGTFTGDTTEGNFRVPVGIGDIEGHYTIASGVIKIDITKKPLLVSCKLIEEKLRGYLVQPPTA